MTDRTITLGAETFTIAPLDLGTLKKIGVGSAKMQSKEKTNDEVAKEGAWYDGTFEVISAATGKPIEEVMLIKNVTLQELLQANRTIFLITGLVTAKEERPKAPGEDAGASTG